MVMQKKILKENGEPWSLCEVLLQVTSQVTWHNG
jgi:hypothetical protein